MNDKRVHVAMNATWFLLLLHLISSSAFSITFLRQADVVDPTAIFWSFDRALSMHSSFCAPGCSRAAAVDNLCTPECNVQSCLFDNGACAPTGPTSNQESNNSSPFFFPTKPNASVHVKDSAPVFRSCLFVGLHAGLEV